MFEPTLAVELREKINSVFYEGRVIPRHTETQHFYEDAEDGVLYRSVTTKTSLLSKDIYKQIAADLAVDHIQQFMLSRDYDPEKISQIFSEAREAHIHNLKRAGSWGTDGHNLTDLFVSEWIKTGKQPEDIKAFIPAGLSNEGVCAGLSVQLFFNDYTLFPIVSEKKILSKKYKYAGTLDSLFLVGSVYKERDGRKDCKHNWFNKGSDKVACGLCGRQEELAISLLDWKTSNTIMRQYSYSVQVALYAQALKEMCGIKTENNWIVRMDKFQPKYEIGIIPDIKVAIQAGIAINNLSDFANDREQDIRPLIQKTIITL